LGALKVFVFRCNTLKITLLHSKMCFIYEFFGLTQGQILLLSCESSRSQHINKAEVIEQFIRIIVEAVKEPKQRKQTKVPNIEKEKRLKAKKTQSNKKQNRQNPDLSELI
jgi:hypothetical protein